MRTSPGVKLTIVLVVALAVRLAAAWVWQSRLDDRFGFGDSESYWVLGRAVAKGGPYEYTSGGASVFRTPGYPVLLAPIFLIGGEDAPVMWARIEGALLGTLAVGCVFWLARLLFDVRTGLLAAGVAALYPGAVATSVFVLAEAPFVPLMLLHLTFWGLACSGTQSERPVTLAVAAGLAAGTAALMRPSWLLFAPFGLVIVLIAGRRRKRHLAVGLAMMAGLLVAMMPWWLRNARVIGHFVPTTLQVGASLVDGLNPRADGSSNMDFVASFVEAERQDPAGAGGDPADPFEYRLDRRMRSAAVAWARENPGRVASLAGVKFLRMWNVWPNEAAFSAWPVRLAVLASYVPVLVLAVVGAAKTVRRGWPYVLCWLPAVYVTLLHIVFVASIRYRQPAMLPLIVLAAGALASGRRASASSQETQQAGGSEPCA